LVLANTSSSFFDMFSHSSMTMNSGESVGSYYR
jgi:hypothetical protein